MGRPRIDRLTSAQEARLAAICDEWLGHGLSTEPADRPAAEAGVRAAYRAAGLRPPRLIAWLSSPWAGAVGRAAAARNTGRWDLVRDKVSAPAPEPWASARNQLGHDVLAGIRALVWDQVQNATAQIWNEAWEHVGNQAWCQQPDHVPDLVRNRVQGHHAWDQALGQVRGLDPGLPQGRAYAESRLQASVRDWQECLVRPEPERWALIDALTEIGVTGLGPYAGSAAVARCAGWWWAYLDFAIVTDRPARLRRDSHGRLHCGDGPALAYRDGWGMWAWHGRRVPEWVITAPEPGRIATEPNVEVRRCAIESLGWDRFAVAAGLAAVCEPVPDPANPGQQLALYDVPERLWGARVRLLLCANGAREPDGSRRTHGLTVPAGIGDPVEAAAWTVGLARDEYAQLARRT
jgi:hypothetical protein